MSNGHSDIDGSRSKRRNVLSTSTALVPVRLLMLVLAGGVGAGGLWAGAAQAQDGLALPTGGAVVGGAAKISNPAAGQTIVDQSSSRAVIDWRGFDVGAEATVRFNQPDAGAITVNRVTEGGASLIDGHVSANGKVVILNPNGVLIGPGGRIDAAGVVASTARIVDEEKFNALPEDTVLAWRRNGYLAAVYAHLLSMRRWSDLALRFESKIEKPTTTN